MKLPKIKAFQHKYSVPLISLLLVWTFLTVQTILDTDVSRNTLEEFHSIKEFTVQRYNPLLKGERVSGRFVTNTNNLGQLAIRFINSNNKPSDRIIFRIKPEQNNDWYYQAEYNSDQFQSHELFPFGFPPIENSKKQTYLFEIESTQGATESGQIAISPIYPQFTTRHTFSPKGFLDTTIFIVLKILNILHNQDLLVKSFVFAIPLIFYLFLIYDSKNYIPILLPTLALILDLFILPKNNNLVFWIVFLSMIASNHYFHLGPQIISYVLLLCLGSIPLTLVFGATIIAEKLGIWSTILLLAYFVQSMIQYFSLDVQFLTFGQLISRIGTSQTRIPRIERTGIRFINFRIPTIRQLLQKKTSQARSDGEPVTQYIDFRIPTFTIKLEKVSINTFLVELRPYAKLISIYIILRYAYFAIKSLSSVLHAYQDYYPLFSFQLFFDVTGRYALMSFLIWVVIVLFLKLVVKNRDLYLYILLPILFFSLYRINGYIYANTSTFQYEIKIWSIRPKRATLWDEVKITGRNFREMPFKGKIYINGVEHMVLSWKDREIIFQADPTKTKTGEVKIVDYYGKEGGNTIQLDYYDLQTGELIK